MAVVQNHCYDKEVFFDTHLTNVVTFNVEYVR